jgi:putative DNA methylase
LLFYWFGKTEMSGSAELHQSVLRAVLYAMMELVKNVDGNEVFAHLALSGPDDYANQTQRDRVVELADYLAKQLEVSRPDEASTTRILRELVKHQHLGRAGFAQAFCTRYPVSRKCLYHR